MASVRISTHHSMQETLCLGHSTRENPVLRPQHMGDPSAQATARGRPRCSGSGGAPGNSCAAQSTGTVAVERGPPL